MLSNTPKLHCHYMCGLKSSCYLCHADHDMNVTLTLLALGRLTQLVDGSAPDVIRVEKKHLSSVMIVFYIL